MVTKRFFYISLFILFAIMLGCISWVGLYNHNKITRLEFERNILENYRLNQPFLKDQIANLKADKALLQQDVDYYKGKWTSGKLFITYAKGEYTTALIWINVAELVFENNDITFPLYLGDRELNQ